MKYRVSEPLKIAAADVSETSEHKYPIPWPNSQENGNISLICFFCTNPAKPMQPQPNQATVAVPKNNRKLPDKEIP